MGGGGSWTSDDAPGRLAKGSMGDREKRVAVHATRGDERAVEQASVEFLVLPSGDYSTGWCAAAPYAVDAPQSR